MSEDVWTIKKMLDWTQNFFEEKLDGVNSRDARNQAQMIVCHVCNMSKIELFMAADQVLSATELDQLRELVRARVTGAPIQYVLGEAPFRYLTLKVAPGVLIPRPETEVLVSELLQRLPAPKRRVAVDSQIGEYEGARAMEAQAAGVQAAAEGDEGADAVSVVAHMAGAGNAARETAAEQTEEKPEDSETPLLVADICTGSGCIACALATERQDIRVIATDISSQAVALAKENIEACGAGSRACVLQGNLGEPIEKARPQFMGTFDAIISNPPYVPSAVMGQLPHDVSNFEPALALDGGEDGLDLFREILPWAARALKPEGVLAVELHETCLDEAFAQAQRAGFQNVCIARDLANKPRVLTAIKET